MKNKIPSLLLCFLLLVKFSDSFSQSYNSWSSNPLGTTLNSFREINARGGDAGENSVNSKLWLVRSNEGSTWYNAVLHDGITVDASFQTPRVDSRTWWERDPSNDIQSWGNGSLKYFTINKGNVGIGLVNPTYNLEIAGRTKAKSFSVNSVVSDLVDDCPWYGLGSQSNNVVQLSGYYGLLLRSANAKLELKDNGNSYLSGGNVGIGVDNTRTLNNKLEVNGTIRCREVLVESSTWPDYVFAKDYKLKSITEVDNYIKANNHLPDMPAASEVEQNGVKLSELNTKLLQKVEELTLYLIEQNKQLQTALKQNEVLTKRVEKLENK